MLRFLPTSSYTTSIVGLALSFEQTIFAMSTLLWSVSISRSLQDRRFDDTNMSRKWKKTNGHNSHAPQPRRPKQACKLIRNCYELTILSRKQSISLHTSHVVDLRPQSTQHSHPKAWISSLRRTLGFSSLPQYIDSAQH